MEMKDDGSMGYIPCNAKLKRPQSNWDECWKKARLPGLDPENTSFLFSLLHNTLVTQDRLSRTSPTVTPFCKFHGCPRSEHEDLVHALVHCPGNNGVGASILSCITRYVPGISVEEVEENVELPLVWSLAVAWHALWKLRLNKTRPQLYLVRAELEAKVSLLRECRRFSNAIGAIDTIIGNI